MINETWIEALESGEYEQGYHQLCYNDRYCCLGVGELLWAQAHDQEPAWRLFPGKGTPSPEALKWLEINAEFADKLIELNDTERKTFNEIADYIECNL